MAVQKTGNSSVVERAVQWAKEVGEKIKTAVAEYAGASGYAKADKPAVNWFEAAVIKQREHEAKKFAANAEDFLNRNKGEVVDVEPLSIKEYKAAFKRNFPPIHGEYYRRMEPIVTDYQIRAILENAAKDTSLSPEQLRNVLDELGKHKK